jgi:CheY-like chemotaxis protein
MTSSDPIRLLFVDDDTGYMAVAQHILAQYGLRRFVVTWKQDGRSALEFLAGNPEIDLIVVDYYLPEMNGLELARAIRERLPDTPLIFLTSNRDFRLAIEGMKYGVEDYMVKDDAVDSVLPRTIIGILERVRIKRELAVQRKMQRIAARQEEAIKELVVTVCHEFNNPLAAIKISTDILLRQALPAEQREKVQDIDGRITQLEGEVTRLRDINFEKFDFGKIT